MIPSKYNFKEQYAGDTFNGIELVLTDDLNAPIDLTGVQIKMQIKKGTNGAIVKECSITNRERNINRFLHAKRFAKWIPIRWSSILKKIKLWHINLK